MENVFWLTMEALAGKKINMHTHTSRCKHATGEDKEYVEHAIQAGFEVLGFSDHTPYLFEDGYVSPIRMDMSQLDDYVDSVQRLREEYKKDITIYCGLEVEYFPKRFAPTLEIIKQYPMDYLILGQHFFDDDSRPARVGWPRSEEVYLKKYIDDILTGLESNCFLYVAHPDVMNFTGSDEVYEKHMVRLLDELKRRNMPIEINANGYVDRVHYPSERLVKLGVKNGNIFHIAVDAHSPEAMSCVSDYEYCRNLVTKHGGKLMNCL